MRKNRLTKLQSSLREASRDLSILARFSSQRSTLDRCRSPTIRLRPMRIRTWSAALVALAIAASSCSENDLAGPKHFDPSARTFAVVAATPVLPGVRISEFHYDNVGVDSAERVEISAPAGTNLNGWQLVLYNG